MLRSGYGSLARIALGVALLTSMTRCKAQAPAPPAAGHAPAPPKPQAPAPPAAGHAPAPPKPQAAAAPAPPEPAPAPPAAEPLTVNPESRAPGLGVVLASRLNVRSLPQAASAETIRGVLRCGDIVSIRSVVGDAGQWYQVELDKLAGYSHGSYIVRLGPGGKLPLCQFSFEKKKKSAAAPAGPPESDEAVAQRPQLGRAHEPEAVVVPATAPELGHAIAEQSAPPPQPPPAGSPPAGSGPELAAAPAPPDAAAAGPQAARSAAPGAPPEAAGATRVAAAAIDAGRPDIPLGLRAARARPVEFPHKKHQAQFACFRCHHPVATTAGVLRKVVEGDVNAVKGCHSCHTASGQPAVRPTSEDVFHSLCRDCHRTAGSKRAPTGCPDCHK